MRSDLIITRNKIFAILIVVAYLCCVHYLIHMQRNHNLASGESSFAPSKGLSDGQLSMEATLFNAMETKEIEGYPNYFVTSNGDIYNRDYKGKGIVRQMKLTRAANGYLTVRLGRKSGLLLVHRLIAEAFIPNPEGKRTVNHKNMVKSDNYVSNLEWATYQENHVHSFKNGRRSAIGEGVHTSKLTADQVLQIRRLYKPRVVTYTMLAEMFGISWWQVKEITDRNDWKHI